MNDYCFTHRTMNGFLWLSLLVVFGCGPGITVQVNYDKETNFAALRSFSFKEMSNPSSAERRVQQAIQTDLLARGYNEVRGAAPADFHVAYHVALQKKTIWQREYSPRGVPTGVIPITFNEGTIAIQLIDPKTEKVVWTGQAEEAVDNQSQALDEIQTEVSKILARFPPG